MTETSGHTPGPWIVRRDLERIPVITAGGGRVMICDASPSNAPLIAAAPELLDALASLADVATEAHVTAHAPQVNVIERLGRAIDRARAALTKARARTER